MPQAKTILEHPTVQRARLRAKCERAVDRLLAVLDLIDGDPDAEPSLGFAEPRQNPHAYGALDQTHIAEGATDDREDEHDGREPDEDAEDTLGRTEAIDQSRRQVGADDLEPSLGSLHHTDQRAWGDHQDPRKWSTLDGEEQCEDEGAQCDDEGDISADLPAPDYHPSDQRLISAGVFAGVPSYHDLDGRKPANDGG